MLLKPNDLANWSEFILGFEQATLRKVPLSQAAIWSPARSAEECSYDKEKNSPLAALHNPLAWLFHLLEIHKPSHPHANVFYSCIWSTSSSISASGCLCQCPHCELLRAELFRKRIFNIFRIHSFVRFCLPISFTFYLKS